MPGKLGNSIPTVAVWTTQSNVWNARREAIVLHIDQALAGYNTSIAKSSESVQSLSELYYSLDYWLKEAARASSQVAKGRQPVVYELYVLVVEKLCQLTGLSVNLLPRWLEETFGKSMTKHGYDKDHRDRSALYLSAEQVRKYRLTFKTGLAYQQSWWLNSANQVPVDTMVASAAHALGKTMFPNEANHQGYVLSMSRDFYMMQHITPKAGESHGTGQYHSSYFAGETVLCAGTLKITAGRVNTVTTASGHYAPGITHLSNAVATLAMLGVELDGLVGWIYGEPSGRKAIDILADRSIAADSATRYETERRVGIGIMNEAQDAERKKALFKIRNASKEKAEEEEIVQHFKVKGHSRFKCGVCTTLNSRGTYAKYFAMAQNP
jgi:hypothetical protein